MSERLQDCLHARLRAATAAEHDGLERDLDWQARVASLDSYRGLLARLRGFHAAYEPAIGRALGDDAFFGPRRRLARLDADLSYLGLDAAGIAALPAPPPVVLQDRAEALGALYVLEGSTLGGQVIARQIERLHGLSETGGCAYYRAHGRAAAAMWAAFRAELETLAGDPAAEAAALGTGIATFAAMRRWLVPATGAQDAA